MLFRVLNARLGMMARRIGHPQTKAQVDAQGAGRVRHCSSLVVAFLVYVGVVIRMTWPLASEITTHMAVPRPRVLFDTLFTAWSLAWTSHALSSAPSDLFNANIYYPAKSLGDKVDFHSLLRRFNSRNLVRAIAYVVEAPDVDISPFVTALTSIGFEVKTKPIKIFDDGTRKGDWDIGIAVDAVSLAEKVDVITLVTGDGDFESLVNHLKWHGVKVEVMAFQQSVSHELLRSLDEFIPITEDLLLKRANGTSAKSTRA